MDSAKNVLAAGDMGKEGGGKQLERPRILAGTLGSITDEDKIILVYRGCWDGSVYKNGEEVLVFMSLQTISFEEFLDDVHKIVRADRRICDYVLHCLITTEDCGVVKSRIMSARDLQRVARMFRTPKIFVTVKPKQHHGTGAPSFHGSQSIGQSSIHGTRQDSFVQLMASQGTYGNPFAYGGPIPVGYNFPTGYGMNYMHYPAPYLSAPYIHGAGPSTAPYLSAPYGAGPNSAPIVDQPKPSSTPIVNQPRPPSSAPNVDQPCIPNKAVEMDQPFISSTRADVPQVEKMTPAQIINPRQVGQPTTRRIPAVGEACRQSQSTRADVPQVERRTPAQRINLRQACRPRTRRIPAAGEACSQSHRPLCSRCSQSGHNRTRYTTILPLPPAVDLDSASSSNKVTQSLRRQRSGPRRCGNCREVGHTKRFCPTLPVNSSEEEG